MNRVPENNANIVNKSSSSKIQEGMCRQLNLEYPNFD